jgi:Do/DeqQ family serine protease
MLERRSSRLIFSFIMAVALVAAGFYLHSLYKAKFPAGTSTGLLTQRQEPLYESSDEPSGGEGRVVPDQAILATQNAFVKVSAKVTPAVVNISTVQTIRGRRTFEPFSDDPFYRDFFDNFFSSPREYKSSSLGSGVIINKDGYILTNSHVVRGASEITVRLSDKHEYKGRVVGADNKTDLAVIKIDAPNALPVAVLGNSDKIKVGEWAVAIGNPFGLDRTVTVGVISATGRSDVGITAYENFIQTDASINPGNSGGPLCNIYGEVIGINTAIVSAGQGIGFAVPVNMAKKVITDLIKTGKVTRGWLGVGIQPMTPDLAKSFGLKENEGVLISQVMKGSPAEKAGLKEGDVILEMDGQKFDDHRQLQRMIGETPVGKTLEFTVIRDQKRLTVKVTIGEMPSEEKVAKATEQKSDLGINVQKLTPQLAERLGLPEAKGVLVSKVDQRSPAARAGLRKGDVIIEFNREPIEDISNFQTAVKKISKGDQVMLRVIRGEAILFLAFKV